MNILYVLGLRAYKFLLLIVSNFNTKAAFWINGRKNWEGKLIEATKNWRESFWIHCASLGEFEQGRPVIEEIKKRYPDLKIIVTFFSPSGYEVRKNYDKADYVCYLPIDTRANAKRFVQLANPKYAVFVKYEFWRNYLDELHKNNVKTFLISSIFREDQAFFKWYGGWYRKLLFKFDHIFVQNKLSVELLNSIKVSEVSLSGDTRFDRVYDLVKNHTELESAKLFKDDKKLIVAGSTWPKDEELIIEFINKNNDYKYIIAAHEVSEKSVERIVSKLEKKHVLWTKMTDDKLKKADVLIVNTMGVLSKLYYYGELAYIGGGFGVGIHNTLEAATYGLPLMFGPNYRKFQEAKDLISFGGAVSVSDYEELEQAANTFLKDTVRINISNKIKTYVNSNIGISASIVDYVFK